MEGLRPCPFCGGEAKIQEYNGGFAAVGCSNGRCYMHPHAFGFASAEDAIQKWNRRAKRTCRYVRDHMGVAGNWFCKCSECGAEFDERVVDRHFVYCPECGALVIGEETDNGN